jgi:hypothetical protein
MRVGRQILGLLGWMGLATYLYFSTLTLKPMWTDEFATIVFSLGHSFKGISINQLISLPELLKPLQITPTSSWSIVLQRLLTEDTHPPVFFWLNYEWLQARNGAPSGLSCVMTSGRSQTIGGLRYSQRDRCRRCLGCSVCPRCLRLAG